MKNLNYAILLSLALITACGEENKNEESIEKAEAAIEETKAEISDAINEVSKPIDKVIYDFSGNSKDELNKMLEESNKIFIETKAGLEAAEKKVQDSAGEAKAEAEKIRDQHKKRLELLANRIEAIKSATTEENK